MIAPRHLQCPLYRDFYEDVTMKNDHLKTVNTKNSTKHFNLKTIIQKNNMKMNLFSVCCEVLDRFFHFYITTILLLMNIIYIMYNIILQCITQYITLAIAIQVSFFYIILFFIIIFTILSIKRMILKSNSLSIVNYY